MSKSDKDDHKPHDENTMLKADNLLSWKGAEEIGSTLIKASDLKIDEKQPISDKKFTGRFYKIESKEGKITGKLLMMMYLWRYSKLERDGDLENQRRKLRKKFQIRYPRRVVKPGDYDNCLSLTDIEFGFIGIRNLPY